MAGTPINTDSSWLRSSQDEIDAPVALMSSYDVTSQDVFGTPINTDSSWLRLSQNEIDAPVALISSYDVPSQDLFCTPINTDSSWLRSSPTEVDAAVQVMSSYDVTSQDIFGTLVNTDSSWLHSSQNDIDVPAEMMSSYDITSEDIFGPPMDNTSNQALPTVMTAEQGETLESTPINFEYQHLLDHKVRSVYLITYSQADTTRFNRQTFAEAVVSLFNNGKAKVVKWVCGMENHCDGGKHFHLAVKLTKLKRWKSIKNEMMDLHGVVLHFSDIHSDYSDAWHYVTKEDKMVIQSPNHPEEVPRTAPRTKRASVQKKGKTKGKGKVKVTRMTPLAFTQLIRKHNIRRLVELYSFMKKEERSGNFALAEFFHNRKKNKVEELITNTWDIEESDAYLKREKMSRLDILSQYMEETPCLCNGEWLMLALQTLSNNHISREDFASSVITLLEDGRKKGANILVKGEADCGKSFLFYPLKKIFRCFANPASSTFNWLGVENAEVIFLNDFRWTPQVIPWFQLLQLLEGDEVKFPAPKNHAKENIIFTRDCPIFATSADEIVSNQIGSLMVKETKMMKKRWKVYEFTHEIPQEEIKEVKPCGVCFCKLITDPEHLFA